MKELWYFYADWCQYCQKQNPILDEFIAEHPEITVVRINGDQNQDAMDHNGVKGFPAFIPLTDTDFGPIKAGVHSKEQILEFFAK